MQRRYCFIRYDSELTALLKCTALSHSGSPMVLEYYISPSDALINIMHPGRIAQV